MIKEASEEQGAVAVQYGSFINTIINFLIVALCLFAVIKGIQFTAQPLRRSRRNRQKKPSSGTHEEKEAARAFSTSSAKA